MDGNTTNTVSNTTITHNTLSNSNTSNDEHEEEINPEKLIRPALPSEHPLHNTWTFWYVRRVQGGPRTTDSYEKNIKPIGAFNTVEGFWSYYNHLLRPNDLPVTSDYHLFKHNIRPLWEDEINRNGGKWIVRLRKGMASKYWEDLILATLGEQFDVGDDICGIVMSIRYQEDLISIWNKSANDEEINNRIQTKMKEIFAQLPGLTMEYKAHDTSLKDHTSFRNAEQVVSPFANLGHLGLQSSSSFSALPTQPQGEFSASTSLGGSSSFNTIPNPTTASPLMKPRVYRDNSGGHPRGFLNRSGEYHNQGPPANPRPYYKNPNQNPVQQ
eukprot:TRINITY_DN4955_c1_g1_i1.p1 TRINITY_DN4955_c1_g1~~TRINITY_DN4955_c1_g1_i1.p1  ORF type:complete len:327 (-),score=72.77 TRINITY_DN4955_c1_g1_i1:42-1022(-)